MLDPLFQQQIRTKLSHCHNDNDVSNLLVYYCQLFNIDYYFFKRESFKNKLYIPESEQCISNYPHEVMQLYFEQDYLDKDFAIYHGRNFSSPLIWPDHLDQLEQLDPKYKETYLTIREMGIFSGISFPYQQPRSGSIGLFSLAWHYVVDPNFYQYNQSMLLTMQTIGAEIFDYYNRLYQPNYNLTSTELKVIKLVAIGLSASAIAKKTGIKSVRTVEKHIANLRIKTGAENKSELSLIALRSGFYS